MRQEEYIYIIKRDGTVYEILGEAKGRTVKSTTDALNNRTLIYFEDIDTSVNGADVSEVVGLEMYLNYINTKRPKMYVRKGKTRMLARDEKVKPELQEKLRQERIALQAGDKPLKIDKAGVKRVQAIKSGNPIG